MDSKKTIDYQKSFVDFSHDLLDKGVSYVSLILLDDKNSPLTSYTSNGKWQEYYIENSLFKNCHIMRYVLENYNASKHKSFIHLWDTCYPDNEESLFLQSQRKEYKICHGVAFCSEQKDGTKKIITVASQDADINFGLKVLENKKIIYNSALKHLTKVM